MVRDVVPHLIRSWNNGFLPQLTFMTVPSSFLLLIFIRKAGQTFEDGCYHVILCWINRYFVIGAYVFSVNGRFLISQIVMRYKFLLFNFQAFHKSGILPDTSSRFINQEVGDGNGRTSQRCNSERCTIFERLRLKLNKKLIYHHFFKILSVFWILILWPLQMCRNYQVWAILQ